MQVHTVLLVMSRSLSINDKSFVFTPSRRCIQREASPTNPLLEQSRPLASARSTLPAISEYAAKDILNPSDQSNSDTIIGFLSLRFFLSYSSLTGLTEIHFTFTFPKIYISLPLFPDVYLSVCLSPVSQSYHVCLYLERASSGPPISTAVSVAFSFK